MNDIDAALEYLSRQCLKLTGVNRLLCDPVLYDERFVKGYGSGTGTDHSHHSYKGGLVVHTAEVMQTALAMASTPAFVADPQILTIAALWHDYAKIHDYDGEGKGTNYRKLIRHVSGSYQYYMRTVDKVLGFPPDSLPPAVVEIGHCILAHHGRKEWGSPIEPQTKEASILHYADMMSMQYGLGR